MPSRNRLLFAALGCAALAGACLAAGARPAPPPLALHPANPHYFLFRGRPAVLVTSGEHYGAVLNLEFDYVRYLDELHARGLNLTRAWSGSYRELPTSFGITDNTLAPAPGRYVCPWARTRTPGSFDSGGKFDLDRWDPAYFRRLKGFLAAASRRGIVVELNLFCPFYDDSLWRASPMNAANNVNGVGACPAGEVYTLQHPDLLAVQEAVTRKIVDALRGYDNLYYEVCNEPYFGGVTTEWQHHMVDVIVAAERRFPHKHLISLNVANGSAIVAAPPPAVSIFNFHYATPPTAVALNYGLNRVIGENETGFRGKADVLYRTEGWEFLMAGGALYNNLDYSFTVAHPDGTFLDYRSPGGGGPALRRQLQILKTFLERFDFVRMAPDDAVLQGGLPAGVTARVLAERGRQYAVYLRGGTRADVRLALPAGTYAVEWRDTKTGEVAGRETLRHPGGDATLRSPAYSEDIALSVRAGPTRGRGKSGQANRAMTREQAIAHASGGAGRSATPASCRGVPRTDPGRVGLPARAGRACDETGRVRFREPGRTRRGKGRDTGAVVSEPPGGRGRGQPRPRPAGTAPAVAEHAGLRGRGWVRASTRTSLTPPRRPGRAR